MKTTQPNPIFCGNGAARSAAANAAGATVTTVTFRGHNCSRVPGLPQAGRGRDFHPSAVGRGGTVDVDGVEGVVLMNNLGIGDEYRESHMCFVVATGGDLGEIPPAMKPYTF